LTTEFWVLFNTLKTRTRNKPHGTWRYSAARSGGRRRFGKKGLFSKPERAIQTSAFYGINLDRKSLGHINEPVVHNQHGDTFETRGHLKGEES